jgi:mannose-6-phosphate isomerase-like protein (cupin superfamily)
MSKRFIKAEKSAKEYLTAERCFITELMNDEAIPEVSLAQARIEPGVVTRWHTVSVAEWHIIVQGNGLAYVGDDEPFVVNPGDKVVVPIGTRQRFGNTGDTDLLLYCICMPRFTAACYESVGDE